MNRSSNNIDFLSPKARILILPSRLYRIGLDHAPEKVRRVVASRTGKAVISGVFWTMCGSVVSRLLQFLAALFVARILAPQIFGEFGLIRTTLAAFVEIGGATIGYISTKYIAELLVVDKGRIGRVVCLNYCFLLGVGLFSSAILFFSAPWICSLYPKISHLVTPFRIASLLLVAMIFDVAQKGVISGFHDYRGLSHTNIISAVIALPSLAFGAYYGGLVGVLAAQLFAFMMSSLVNSLRVRTNLKKYDVRYSFRGMVDEIPVFWKMGSFMLFGAAVWAFAMWYANVQLARTENGFFQLGLYTAAMLIYAIISFLPGQLNQILIPIASQSLAEKNVLRYRRVALCFLGFAVMVGLLFSVPIAFFSDKIMMIYGSGYEAGSSVLIVIVFTATVAGLQTMTGLLLIASGRVRIGTLGNVLFSIVLLCSNSYFQSRGMGAMGLALALLLGGLAATSLNIIWVFRRLPEDQYDICT